MLFWLTVGYWCSDIVLNFRLNVILVVGVFRVSVGLAVLVGLVTVVCGGLVAFCCLFWVRWLGVSFIRFC